METVLADGAVIPPAVLGFWSVVTGKDDGEVMLVEDGAAGRIDSALEPAHSVAGHAPAMDGQKVMRSDLPESLYKGRIDCRSNCVLKCSPGT
jgi:hypothetical protein